MISKKNALVWLTIITVTCCFITFMLTYFFVRSERNAAGEIYISNDQYNLLMRYSDLNQVEQIVENYYYDDTNRDQLLEGAKKGLVRSLNDPYSVYFTKEEFTSLFDKLDGVFTGLGITILQDRTDGVITVNQVFADSPAFEADIAPGDKVIAVNDEIIVGFNTEMAAEKMRGPDGTKVKLTVKRGETTADKVLTRRPVEIDKVAYTMEDDIGFISIFEFTGNCAEMFAKAIEDMKAEEVKGVVIDIRDNPGGRLTSVKEIADMLLPEGKIFFTRDRAGEEVVQESNADFWDIPLVVLVNGNSASASEILAGAVQDFGRGKIIGETTYGKGVVQDIISIPETGAGVKITTAVYLTPNGRMINKIGIVPDIEVKSNANFVLEQNPEDDVQLQEAIKVLKQQIGS